MLPALGLGKAELLPPRRDFAPRANVDLLGAIGVERDGNALQGLVSAFRAELRRHDRSSPEAGVAP